MLSSAVSAALVLVAAGPSEQLTGNETSAWQRIQPSVAVLMQGGAPSGTAALIDSSGLFLAHRTAVPARALQARMPDGRILQMRWKADDETTGFVLLEAAGWTPGQGRPVGVSGATPRPGTRLFAALSGGPIRAEFVAGDRLGVMGAARRLMPLAEVKFEAPLQTVAGALLFSPDGNLIGAVNATLEGTDDLGQRAMQNMQQALSNLAGGVKVQQRFGPSQLTVAYTVSPAVMLRVVDGFRTPPHEVVHPAIGVFCRDAIGGGAEIERVVPGSPAEQAGLRPADVIFAIGGVQIFNQIDFARVMMNQRVGSKVTMQVRRGARAMLIDVRVGK
jgi:hypothetical protein